MSLQLVYMKCSWSRDLWIKECYRGRAVSVLVSVRWRDNRVLVGSNPGGIRLELGVNFVRVFAIKTYQVIMTMWRCSSMLVTVEYVSNRELAVWISDFTWILLRDSAPCHVSTFYIQEKLKQSPLQEKLTLRLLMSYIYGAPILDVSRSYTTTHHSR